MQVFLGNGVRIGGVSIDPVKRSKRVPKNAVITHAHSDHVCLNNETEFLLSEETLALVNSRFGKVKNGKGARFGEKHVVDGQTVCLQNSGHILGSSQVVIENSKKAVYTSDFKLEDSLLLEGAIPLQSDILVIESTFGLPCYGFPKREQLYSEMGKWIKEKTRKGFVVLAGYSLGKAQELTKIVNEFTEEIPLVHESVYKNNKVYEQFGKNLGDYGLLDHNLKESNVLIMPPSLVKQNLLQALEYSLKKKVFSAMATGWAYRGCHDTVFPLSDHADFRQLLEYVQYSKPKMVYTTHGFERELARYIEKRLNIPAKPLSLATQKTMKEFF